MGAYDRRLADWAELAMDQGALWVLRGSWIGPDCLGGLAGLRDRVPWLARPT